MGSQDNKVDVKRAAQAAINYIQNLYADKDLQDLLLEEIEFSEDAHQWLVTIGFSLPEIKETSASIIMPSKTSRELSRRYKIVKIDAATGTPISMKIRVLQ